ncbi:MAG: CDP-diacylglycerol--glycerol-3-phosphate 3-phosphatidyltransferase [Puniceicoccaceae bacterium]|nr:MAG: CDP-diacylglycerol--glycerol-3-phosphate 3-phosphatidyltransferase [Puniceicoccaceae bacterium]
MNLPNFLTLSRIPLMFIIVGLMYAGFPFAATLALVCFILAGITDWLDGAIARKRGLVSNFGILMDALTDKILILGIMIALVDLDKVPIWLVLLILGREFMVTGMRLVAATKGVVVSAEKAGKQKTVTQILAVGAFLLAAALASDFVDLAGDAMVRLADLLDLAGVALIVVATIFTLSSGIRYFVKYRRLVFEESGPSGRTD